MNLTLKALSKEAVMSALERAERYRLLNEPGEAESICLDVLDVDKGNQKAIVTLILSITDQYQQPGHIPDLSAQKMLPRLECAYDRSYYAGVIEERRAKAALQENLPRSKFVAHDLLQEALKHFAEAEKIRPPGDDSAILRWNACVRMIQRRNLTARSQEGQELTLE